MSETRKRGDTRRREGGQGSEYGQGPRGRGGWRAIVASVVLPGFGHLVQGRRGRALRLMLAWAAIQTFHWLTRARIYAAGARSLDDWIAVVTFAAIFYGVWAWALWDVWRASGHPAETPAAEPGGDEADRGAARRAGTHGESPGEAAPPPPPAAGRPVPRSVRGGGAWAIARREFSGNRLAVFGAWVVVGLYLVALMAPLVAPYDPVVQQDLVEASYLAPSAEHLLGTDQFGRDVLSRILYGARISLAIGFIAVAIAVLLGSLLGAVAGYLGGLVDGAIMRFTDLVIAFPRLVLLIMIIALFSRPSR